MTPWRRTSCWKHAAREIGRRNVLNATNRRSSACVDCRPWTEKRGDLSRTADVNYVHYGGASDSGPIEVNQVQQMKAGWRSQRPLLSQFNAAGNGKRTCVASIPKRIASDVAM